MRCFVCNSTLDGSCTDVPFKKSRQFYVDEHKPWLEICSDCQMVPVETDDIDEFAVLEDWDD